MARFLLVICHSVLLSLFLLGCDFGLFLSPGGNGSTQSPFFDDLGGGTRGLVEGYVFAPGFGSDNALRILPDLADPTQYREAPDVQVEILDTEWSATTNSEGRFEIAEVSPAFYILRAQDPQGRWAAAMVDIQVLAGRVTSANIRPAPIGSVRITPYFPLGPEDTWHYMTSRGDRIRERLSDEVIAGTGTYRIGLRALSATNPEEFGNYTLDDQGWRLWGTEAGTFSPPIRLSAPEIRLGDSFSTSTTVTLRTDGTQQPASAISRVATVDDLIVEAGRFDNCVRFDIAINAGPASRTESVWLARGVGPVKIVRSDNQFELQSATVGE